MIQILDLLGTYSDTVVVEVEKYLLFFQIGSGHTVDKHYHSCYQPTEIINAMLSVKFLSKNYFWDTSESSG